MQRIVKLIRPILAAEHIKEKVTCIRAHRERIFKVATQILNNKLICHNYGQGGAGWTFLFGCVNESIRQFEQELEQNPAYKNKPIAIIGAGCYGLLTAICLARKGYRLTIIAKDTQNTPSLKAAGFFFGRARKSSTSAEKAVFEALGMKSYGQYLEIVQEKHPFIKAGVKLLPAYYGLDIDPGFGPYIAKGLVKQPTPVTIDFGNDKTYDVMEYQTVFIDSITLMQELHEALMLLAIPIIPIHIENFDQIDQPIIFNCAGLGAKSLTQDTLIVPVQGHLITLKNQPIEQMQYMLNVKVVMKNTQGGLRDELIYYTPKQEGILGITFIRGQDSLTANQHEFDRLMQRCQDFFG